MARLSLRVLVVAPALTACFDVPPEYSVPKPVPPVVLTNLVSPVTTTVSPFTDVNLPIDFNVPFRSDDEGDGLLAYFVWDMPTPTGAADFTHVADSIDEGRDADLAPSSVPFADQGNTRAVHYSWPPQQWTTRPGLGCHTVTMILSHATNFSHAYDLRDPLAAAQVTWFLGLGATGSACGIAAGTPGQ